MCDHDIDINYRGNQLGFRQFCSLDLVIEEKWEEQLERNLRRGRFNINLTELKHQDLSDARCLLNL